MTSPLLQKILPDLMLVVRRFPVPVAISLFMYGFFVLEIENISTFTNLQVQRAFQAGIAAFFAAGGMHLFGESHSWSLIKSSVAALLLAVGIAAVLYFQSFFEADALLVIPATVLWVMIAGFLRAPASFNMVWLFNSRLFTAAALATIVGLVFAGGIAAILASLDYLFHIKASNEAYEHVFNLAIAIIGPVYGLALLPENIDEELSLPRGDDLLNRGVSILINYVMVPVLLVYVIILHAYAAKIGLSWTLPRGKVGIMVLNFGIGGTATWLIARPWVETGTRLLQIFTRYWFWFTIIPTIMLALAVSVRINTYGVTPERYGLVLVAIWLALMVLYFTKRRIEAKPQIIMGTMALLLLAGSFGPWGAYGVSVNSQYDRLVTLLSTSGFIKNGKIAENLNIESGAARHNRRNARSIIRFLQKNDALNRLEPLFHGHSRNPFEGKNNNKYTITAAIYKLLGYNRPGSFGQDHVAFNARRNHVFKVKQDSILIGQLSMSSNGEVAFGKIGRVSLEKGQLHISHDGRQWQISARSLLKQVKERKTDTTISLTIPSTGQDDSNSQPAYLMLKHLNGTLNKERAEIRYMTFWLALPTR